MSAFPSLPLFTDAWVADTKHLTRLERGTYHDLLVLMWRSPDCRVPNDDVWLARRMGMTVDEVRAELRPIIAEFMHTDGNWLFQKRLTKEWEWCKKNSKQRSAAAKAMWARRKGKSKRITEDDEPRNAPNLSPPTVDSEADASESRAMARKDDWPADAAHQFWERYPRKVAKRTAMRALISARRRVSWGELTAGLERMIATTDPTYIPHAATWLNGDRWADEARAPPSRNGPPTLFDPPRGSRHGKPTLSERAGELAQQVRAAEIARGAGDPDDAF